MLLTLCTECFQWWKVVTSVEYLGTVSWRGYTPSTSEDKRNLEKWRMKEHNSWGTARAEWEAPRKAGRRARRRVYWASTVHQVHRRQLMQVLSLNLFTLGEWSSWEELVKFREDRVFPKAILVLRRESQREWENLDLYASENGRIQLDRLGEFREGLKVICGAEYLELEDRETQLTGSAKPDFE